MGFDFYYYESDFANGNGWRGDEFVGEVISTPNYRFAKGKYEGRSLQELMSRSWKGIKKYIDYGCIVLQPSVFRSLRGKRESILALETATDAKSRFDRIYSIYDTLHSEPFAGKHEGDTLLSVAENDPEYLKQLVYRSYFPFYGQNQRFYVDDKGIVFDDFGQICQELADEDVSRSLLSTLKGYKDELESMRREREAYFEAQQEAEWNRMFLEDAYREAYNDDPDAMWNTD